MRYRSVAIVVAALITAASPFAADAQDLSRGHRILLDKGLQLQALYTPGMWGAGSLERWRQSNYTTINLGAYLAQANILNEIGPDYQWSAWRGEPAWNNNVLSPGELPYLPGLVSFQLRDEQDMTDQANLDQAKDLFAQWRGLYPDVIVFTNQHGHQMTDAQIAHYQQYAQPDMLMFDHYVFNSEQPGGSPTDLYGVMQKYRLRALAGNDGTGATPIPYGQYIGTYAYGPDPYVTSVSELRLMHNASWAFGYTFLDTYKYVTSASGVQSTQFSTPGDTTPTVQFYHVAETNRQSRNLGPALVRLISRDIRFVRGQHRNAQNQVVNNAVPTGVQQWTAGAVPYMTGVSATNVGTANDGLRGDVLVGYLTPLLEEFDGLEYENEVYFMIVNGLTASRPATGSLAATTQQIRVDFDFTGTDITQLLRLSRDTGEVEIVPLIHDGGSKYHLLLTLGGGEGDLFKYDTGARFVPEPAAAGVLGLGMLTALRRRRARPAK